MSDWRAITETGTTYTYHDRILYVHSKGTGHAVYKASILKSGTYDGFMTTFQEASTWKDTDRAVIGECLFVGSFGGWRISTPIVSVEDIESEPIKDDWPNDEQIQEWADEAERGYDLRPKD